MSLIDEALKRARLDAARAEPQQRRGPYPWVSAQPGQAAAARRSRRALVAGVLAGSLGAALLGGAGLWLTTRHAVAAAHPAATAGPTERPAATSATPATPANAAIEGTDNVAATAAGNPGIPAAAGTLGRAATAGEDASSGAPHSGTAGRSDSSAPAGETPVPSARAARAAARAVLESQGAPGAQGARSSAGPAASQDPAPQPHAAARPERAQASAVEADGRSAAAPVGGADHRPAVSPAAAPPAPSASGAAASPAPPLVDGREYSREVALPGGGKLALSGIAFSEHQPVAVINGRVVGPGEVVSEFTVARIQPDRVELRGHGLTIFLLLN